MIWLGGSGVVQTGEDPADWARAHKQFGYTAAYCPEGLSLEDMDTVRAVRDAYAREDVVIAEVGAWGNLVPPNPEQRARQRKFVCERLALADELGALCCVDYIGTLLPDSEIGPHPDNLSQVGFDLCVEVVRDILDTVQPTRTRFCLEMMQTQLPDSPEVYMELIRAIDRPAFGVHIDPVNLIVSPRLYFNTGAMLRHCFSLLGPWVVSCHAKDIILRDTLSLHLDEIIPGKGNLDYAVYLQELDRLPGEVPLMLEHLETTEEYATARDHILAVGQAAGVQFKSVS